MFRLRCFKRFKTTSFIALAALLVCAVGAYTVHATHSTDDDGYDRKVYWELSVGHLDKEDGWAYSEHHFYVQNDRDGRIMVEWEFSHKILKHGSTDFDLPDDTIDGSFTLEGLDTGSGDDLRQYYSSLRNTPYDHLPKGSYFLEAYTRLDIKDDKKRKIASSKKTKTLNLN